LKRFLFLFALPLLLPAPVRAQDDGAAAPAATAAASRWYDYNPVSKSKFDEHGIPFGKTYYTKTPSKLYMSLLRRPDLPEDKVILHLALGDSYTGCPKLSDLQSRISISESVLSVAISDYRVDMRNLPQDPQQCSTRQQFPSMDIILGRDDLIEHGVTSARLQLSKGIDIYDIKVDNEKIQIQPSVSTGGLSVNFQPQKLRNVANPLLHWFYPENTLILSIPDAGPKEDTKARIAGLAQKLGLTPLEEIYPDFRSPLIVQDQYYYVDQKGDTALKIKPGEPAAIGTVTVPKTVYGLVADETVEDDLPVYAHRPGAYE
jgi:hypothetical protein